MYIRTHMQHQELTKKQLAMYAYIEQSDKQWLATIITMLQKGKIH